MGHNSFVKNPSQVWGGDTSFTNQIGDFIAAPFQKAPTANLATPPPPPTPGMATAASLQNQVQQEANQFASSPSLTGGTGTGQPVTASNTLLGR